MRLFLILAVAVLWGVDLAQTPHAMAASRSRESGKQAAFSKVQGVPMLPQVAAKAWNTNPRATETTQAFEARLEKDLRKLFSTPRKKMTPADGGWWRVLNYLQAVPYESLREGWKVWYLERIPNPRLSATQRQDYLRRLEKKKLWQMTPKEAEVWVGELHRTTPALRERVLAIARKNIGQPYRMYLLGEYPYEIFDGDPTLDLSHGDCVVFSEHVYSMALSPDWKTFYSTLQQMRYKNGAIGMTTRNHYTVADWNRNNSWLVKDISRELGATTVTAYRERVDRAKFFTNFGIGHDIPVETIEDAYIPAAAIEGILNQLKPGDFVNVVRGRPNGGAWVGHVGLVGKRPDGTTTFIHSTEPRSIEQPMMEYVRKGLDRATEARKKERPEFLGLKFLRLVETPQVPVR
jgi:hypothetical protein